MSTPRQPYVERIKERNGKLYYERLTLLQRVQHIVLFVSFFILIATGFPLLFPNSEIVRHFFFFEGAFELRGALHRLAAVALILDTAFHIFYVLFFRRGNQDLRQMVLNLDDFFDPFRVVLYNLGKRKEMPKYERFNFIEKFEYYAVVWGTGVMIVTGLALWFPVEATILMPRWVLDIIRVIHGFEAILAFLAIIIWHMYNVHLNPEVFPMSRIWIDGLQSMEEFKHHHGKEYDKMMDVLSDEMKIRVKNQVGEPVE